MIKLEEFNISVPPVEEQRRIAEALGDVDALIGELERLVEKKRLVKQGAMQQLLTGRRRLPGFSAPWKTVRLADIGTFSKGKGISRSEAQTGSIPAIRYGEIYTCHNDYIKHFTSHISNEVARTSVKLEYGQILFTCSGETKEDIAKAVAFVGHEEAYVGGDIIILTPTVECDPFFLGFLCNARTVNAQKSEAAQGDAVVHISTDAIRHIQICFPPIAEQRAIAAILTDMDAEIDALEQKLAKLRQAKQGMMQQLLTGRIRLTVENTV